MRYLTGVALLLTVALSIAAQPYTFRHWVGTRGGPGDVDGTGIDARFMEPRFVATDAAGNVYVSDTSNHIIRKITPAGDVSTVAGVERQKGYASGFRQDARFDSPQGLAVDASGNLFVADNGNHVVRKITPGGLVTTLAGMPGASGYVNGTGSAARFFIIFGLACDAAGNVYVAEYGSNTIRKITPAGVVTTFAGATDPGIADGPGDDARFRQPTGVAVDASNNVYVADWLNHTIRKITPARVVSTIAGVAGTCGFLDGPAASSQFCAPRDVAVNGAGEIFVADSNNRRVRMISGTTVTTFAGSAQYGSDDGPATSASFRSVDSVAADGSGNVYVTDSPNHTIRKVSAGTVSTFAGLAAVSGYSQASYADGRFSGPDEIVVDTNGHIFVADSANSVIRKISSGSLSAVAFAGTPGINGNDDGTGASARFRAPTGLGIDTSNNLYVADSNASTIRKITPLAEVTTVAGTPYLYGSDDGTGAAARFNMPRDVAADASDNLYVADSGNHTIRKITSGGVVTTLAGLAGFSGTADGTTSAARFEDPSALTIASDGNLYVADRANQTIRKVTMEGVVTTLAGSPDVIGSQDGSGAAARFNYPTGIAADGSGNLFVTESQHTIRQVTLAGEVTTIAGSAGVQGTQEGTGALARFQNLNGIATHPFVAALFVTDGHAVRRGGAALPDAATIDAAEGAVGAVRQLSTTSPTANLFSWTIVRRPPGSSAFLSAPSTRTPTFVPDVQGRYTFRLLAALGSPTSITEVDLVATTTAPGSLTISPATLPNGARLIEYATSVSASGGTPPYVFTTTGTLPPGVVLGESGTFSGVATTAGSFNFTVHATDSVGATGARSYTVTIVATAPAVEAHATGAASIAVAWPVLGGAAGYRVYRSVSGLSFFPVADVATSPYTDTDVMNGFAYLYRVVALDSADRQSQPGAYDLAVAMVMQDSPLVPGVTPVKAAHFTQLREAANSVRFLAGIPSMSFSDAMVPGLGIKALHITQLRTAISEARAALSLSAVPATAPPPGTGDVVKAAHVEDLRAGVK